MKEFFEGMRDMAIILSFIVTLTIKDSIKKIETNTNPRIDTVYIIKDTLNNGK
jgi:hypothetical protein